MPVDTGIYANLLRPVKSIADYDAEAQAMQGNALAMQMRRQQIDGNALSMRQGVEAQQRNALVREAQRKAAEGAGGDELAYVRGMRLSGMPELMDPADKAEKSLTERANVNSQIGGRTSENAKRDTDTAIARVGQWRDFVGMAQNPQQAAALVQLMHADPALKDTPIAKAPLDQVLGMLQSKPFDQWKAEFALGAKDFIEKNKPQFVTQNLGGSSRISAIPGLVGAPAVVSQAPITQSADNAASNARMAADAAAGRSQSASQFNQRLAYDRDKDAKTAAGGGGGKVGPMSVTLQKELLESDDAVQSSAAVISALQKGLEINKQAYSGYLAKPRATLRSNLPGQSPGADATINLDNMMTGQALESLKVTFGAAPTEGERKILMEMQASADKTPQQREDIMNRAIAAAKRRGEFAARKADSIRSGKYLTDGVAPAAPSAPAPMPAPAGRPAVGAVQDGYRFKGGDPSKQSSWEKQ